LTLCFVFLRAWKAEAEKGSMPTLAAGWTVSACAQRWRAFQWELWRSGEGFHVNSWF
jgi:hypothetical protein